LKAVIYPLKI